MRRENRREKCRKGEKGREGERGEGRDTGDYRRQGKRHKRVPVKGNRERKGRGRRREGTRGEGKYFTQKTLTTGYKGEGEMRGRWEGISLHSCPSVLQTLHHLHTPTPELWAIQYVVH